MSVYCRKCSSLKRRNARRCLVTSALKRNINRCAHVISPMSKLWYRIWSLCFLYCYLSKLYTVINQSIDRSFDQSILRSIDQSIYLKSKLSPGRTTLRHGYDYLEFKTFTVEGNCDSAATEAAATERKSSVRSTYLRSPTISIFKSRPSSSFSSAMTSASTKRERTERTTLRKCTFFYYQYYHNRYN